MEMEMEMKESSQKIRVVWARNFQEELTLFNSILHVFPIISFDTEFPGFLRNTPRNASELSCYQDLKYNVDNLKLIQLGLTLSDAQGRIGGTWEFNFKDFNETKDLKMDTSISLLKQNGLDLSKFHKDGVEMKYFSVNFLEIFKAHRGLKWITFHGLYDLAYLLRLLTRQPLPDTAKQYATVIGLLFPRIFDVKFMARACPGLLGGEIGLERLSKILQVERIGTSHQAGSDSLLTAAVFIKMKRQFHLVEEMHQGFLYGISERIVPRRPMFHVFAPPPQTIYFPAYHPLPMCPTPSPFVPLMQHPVHWHH